MIAAKLASPVFQVLISKQISEMQADLEETGTQPKKRGVLQKRKASRRPKR